jgi:hypothetical protein
MPSEFSRRDLQDLIQQYSWNVGQHPLLLEAALAAGLYPNFAFAELNSKLRTMLKKAENSDLQAFKVGCLPQQLSALDARRKRSTMLLQLHPVRTHAWEAAGCLLCTAGSSSGCVELLRTVHHV